MTLGASAVSRLIAGQGERPPATFIPVAAIEVVPGHNPRGQVSGRPAAAAAYDPFSAQALSTLMESLQSRGLLQPILVVKHPTRRDHFLLVAGERRLQAYQLLNVQTPGQFAKIAAVIHSGTFDDALELAITENGQREDPDLVDETWAVFTVLAQLTGRPRDEVPAYLRQLRNGTASDEFGVEAKLRSLLGNRAASLSTWAQRRSKMLLLRPAEVDAVGARQIPITTALHLTLLSDAALTAARQALLVEAVNRGWSASEVEVRVQGLLKPAEAAPSTLRQLRQRLPELGRLQGVRARKAEKLMRQLLALLDDQA